MATEIMVKNFKSNYFRCSLFVNELNCSFLRGLLIHIIEYDA